jgi:protein YIPF1/2
LTKFGQVITRCYTTLLPFSPNYLISHTTPSVDLYGPFWTLTTLIFSLFVFSSFTALLVNYLSTNNVKPYSFDFTLLSVGVTLVYSYGLGLPALVWIAMRYMDIVGGSSGEEWSLVEAVASWGYGMFVWIPISVCWYHLDSNCLCSYIVKLLCIIPVPVLRWILVGAGFGLSGFFIFSNVWPILVGVSTLFLHLLWSP